MLELRNTDTAVWQRIAYPIRIGYEYVSDTPWIRILGVSGFLLFLQILDTWAGYVSEWRDTAQPTTHSLICPVPDAPSPRRTPHLCLVTPARLNPARQPATSLRLRSPATSLRPCSPAANDADPGSSHADPSSSELADSRSPASRRPPRPLPARRRGPASRLPMRPTLLPSTATAPALRAGRRCARTGHARPLPARRRGPASRLPVRPPPLPSSALLPAPRCSLQQRGKRVEGPVVEDGKGWGGGGNRKGRVRWGREVEEESRGMRV